MILGSYNQKYGTKYQAVATANNGYQIATKPGGQTSVRQLDLFDPDDSLYNVSVSQGSYVTSTLRIASPCSYNTAGGETYRMSLGGYFLEATSGQWCGLRPVVCLNPNVQLEKISDGKYQIIK